MQPLAAGYVVLITADHGNLEEMTNPDGTPHVAHTTNPVPFILIDPDPAVNRRPARWKTGRCGPDDSVRPRT